jgi:hypothetical protein
MVRVNYGNWHCFDSTTSVTISVSWTGISVGNRLDVERPVIPLFDTGEFAQIHPMAQTIRGSNERSSTVMLLVLPS